MTLHRSDSAWHNTDGAEYRCVRFFLALPRSRCKVAVQTRWGYVFFLPRAASVAWGAVAFLLALKTASPFLYSWRLGQSSRVEKVGVHMATSSAGIGALFFPSPLDYHTDRASNGVAKFLRGDMTDESANSFGRALPAQWSLRKSQGFGHGFNGGPLRVAEHLGVEIAPNRRRLSYPRRRRLLDTPRPPPPRRLNSTPLEPPTRLQVQRSDPFPQHRQQAYVNLSKVSLTKAEQHGFFDRK